MIGALYFFIIIIGLIVAGIKGIYNDGQARQRGIERRNNGKNDANVWLDSAGRYRDLDNGSYRDIRRNGRLDRILVDSDGNVLRNLDREKRLMEAAKQAAEVPEGTKAVFFERWNRKYSLIARTNDFGVMLDEVRGDIYKDIKSGELYIFRKFHWFDNDMSPCPMGSAASGALHSASFYMNIRGYLVSTSDKSLYSHTTEEDCQKFIEHFNRKQSEGGWSVNEYNRKYYYLSAFYCNGNS